MKTKEELKAIKEELKALHKKLSELTEEELMQVSGGSIQQNNDGEHIRPYGKGDKSIIDKPGEERQL